MRMQKLVWILLLIAVIGCGNERYAPMVNPLVEVETDPVVSTTEVKTLVEVETDPVVSTTEVKTLVDVWDELYSSIVIPRTGGEVEADAYSADYCTWLPPRTQEEIDFHDVEAAKKIKVGSPEFYERLNLQRAGFPNYGTVNPHLTRQEEYKLIKLETLMCAGLLPFYRRAHYMSKNGHSVIEGTTMILNVDGEKYIGFEEDIGSPVRLLFRWDDRFPIVAGATSPMKFATRGVNLIMMDNEGQEVKFEKVTSMANWDVIAAREKYQFVRYDVICDQRWFTDHNLPNPRFRIDNWHKERAEDVE